VAARARSKGPGELIRLSPGWTAWAFYLIVALFVASMVALSVVRIDRYARGATATDPAGRVVVLLPAAQAPGIESGSPVTIGGETATAMSSEDTVLYPSEVQERFGVEVTVPSVVVVTSVRPDGTPAPGARILIESEPALVALVPGLKALFGGGDG
jgi:hypothetical protein